jgi:hypothetical protein
VFKNDRVNIATVYVKGGRVDCVRVARCSIFEAVVAHEVDYSASRTLCGVL